MNNKNGDKDKRVKSINFIKVISLGFIYLLLFLFLEPKVNLTNIKHWQKILSSLFLQTYGAMFACFITDVLKIKNNIIRIGLVILTATFSDVFIETNFVFELTLKNIIMVIFSIISFTVLIIYMLKKEKIREHILLLKNFNKRRKIIILCIIGEIVLYLSILTSIVFCGMLLFNNRDMFKFNIIF